MLYLKEITGKFLVLTYFCAPQISFCNLKAYYTENYFTCKVEVYRCHYRVSREIKRIVLIVFNFAL
jgi:hypothetical protein